MGYVLLRVGVRLRCWGISQMPFTDSDLRALQPQLKKYRESAGDALFVEVYPNGGRYFVWRHRFPPGKEGKLSGDIEN